MPSAPPEAASPRGRCAGATAPGCATRRRNDWSRRLGEPLVVIHRNVLTSVLAGALAEGTLRYGVSAHSLVATADGVQVSLSDATTTEADAVVGADGTHSMVARHLNGSLENRYVGYTAWRGVADCSIDPDLAGEVLGPSIEFGHVPLGGDTHLLVRHRTRPRRTQCAAGRADLSQGQVRHLGRAHSHGAGRDGPRPRVAQRPLRPRSRAAMVPGAHRRGGRRRSPDAAASGAGRLSGDRGRGHPGVLRRGGQTTLLRRSAGSRRSAALGCDRWCASRRRSARS